MIRSAANGVLLRRQAALRLRTTSTLRSTNHRYCSSSLLLVHRQHLPLRSTSLLRAFSSEAGDKKKADTKEIVLTPGEKVVAASRLTMWAGIAVFAGFCAYYIGRELLPTKMSPNVVFNKSLEIVKNDPQVKHRYGEPIKFYGRDHGGHREGRRNFIEHTEYSDQADGSKRTRVRYNLEGRFGAAFVFAEVSKDMPSGEFVYILVQDKSNGRVHTIIDNRAALTTARLAGGSKEAQSAMSQLLGGGGSAGRQ